MCSPPSRSGEHCILIELGLRFSHQTRVKANSLLRAQVQSGSYTAQNAVGNGEFPTNSGDFPTYDPYAFSSLTHTGGAEGKHFSFHTKVEVKE